VSEAKFGYTEVKIGFVPAIVMVFLIRKIGEMRAKQLLLSGDPITASEALTLGLINKVVSTSTLSSEVIQFATHLIENNSGNAMMMTKQMIAEVQSLSLVDALDFAARKNASARESEDCKRGIASFLNKNKIVW
jgi:methylglutaconyl-CoA hydratase